MPYIEVDHEVNYFFEDRGSGPTIVMLPGWGVNHLIFEGQVYGLYDRYRVVTIDWRGCGRSSRPATGNTIARVAADTSNLLEALDLHDVTLVGWSLGGNVVAECALTDSRVARVVPVSAGLPKWTDSEGFALGQPHTKVMGWVDSLARHRGEFLREFAAGWFYQGHDADKAWLTSQVMDASWFIDDILRDLAAHDMRKTLGTLTLPAAFFHGRHDKNAHIQLAEKCAQITPGARLEVFENSAHVPFMEEPDEFNRRLECFIRETSDGS